MSIVLADACLVGTPTVSKKIEFFATMSFLSTTDIRRDRWPRPLAFQYSQRSSLAVACAVHGAVMLTPRYDFESHGPRPILWPRTPTTPASGAGGHNRFACISSRGPQRLCNTQSDSTFVGLLADFKPGASRFNALSDSKRPVSAPRFQVSRRTGGVEWRVRFRSLDAEINPRESSHGS